MIKQRDLKVLNEEHTLYELLEYQEQGELKIVIMEEKFISLSLELNEDNKLEICIQTDKTAYIGNTKGFKDLYLTKKEAEVEAKRRIKEYYLKRMKINEIIARSISYEV